jgi:RNA polymerase sigma factor (sigma-70 family)
VTESSRIVTTSGPVTDRDQETARLLARGDQEGLRRLLVDHGGKVLGLLRKEFVRVLDFQEIDDAVSQASVRAWRSGRNFAPERGSLAAWFYVIARNCARRLVEAKGKHAVLSFRDDLDSAAAAKAASAAESQAKAPKDQFLADVKRCIDALAPQQRAVLLADLAAGGSAPTDELAGQLQTTRNSIYVSRNNGRKALRAAMQKLGHTFDGTSAAAMEGWS